MNLSDYVDGVLSQHISGDIDSEIQSVIHPELYFKRNSINLLIGKRGSGKTYNVFREMIKLTSVNNEYSQLIYVTNKLSDDTFHKMKKHIRMNIVKVSYDDVEECLTRIIEAKEDYHEIISKNLSALLDDVYKNELMETLGITDFITKTLHTAVLYDDAIEVFRNRKSKLYKMLFENRQPKITYFLCIQDPIGLDASVKSNLDSAWIFGGFSPQKFNYVFQQLSSPYDRTELWELYRTLTPNQAVIFDNARSGTTIRVLQR